jgi:branched-chain amino acid transport system ATP-binding protein
LAHNLREPAGIVPNLFHTQQYRKCESDCQERANEVLSFLKLDHLANIQANSLPYGNQRMLELGIALMTDPRLLLLDEPAAGMNSTEVETLMDLILRIQAMGVTIILVEHDMKLVMGISERIMVLNYGKQIAMGGPEEIQCNEDVITAYLGRRSTNARAN